MKIIQTGALALAVMALTGCGGMMAGVMGPQLAENGIPMWEYGLRSDFAAGRADSALARLTAEEDAVTPDDQLLAGLYVGTAASYAGEYQMSQRALTTAADMAEDRYTESVTQGIGALITSDNALGYEPGQTERLFIHYYGLMNFAEQGDPQGAAVEARRIGNLLERFDEQQDTVDLATRAALRYVAGAAFEAAGERNDADVAYRNAFALLGDEAAERLPEVTVPGEGEGTLVVVLEHGFVAHLVETPLVVALASNEAEAFQGSNMKDLGVAATKVAARVTLGLASEPDAALFWQGPGYEITAGNVAMAAYVLNLKWPTFRRPPVSAPECAIEKEGSSAPFFMTANVSDAIVGDFRRARNGMLARTIGRAGVKMFATQKIAEKNPLLGGLARLGAGLMETADTRAWNMLPNELGIARLTLPAGSHSDLRIQLGEEGVGQEIELGEVVVAEGGTTVVRVRAF